MAVSCEPSCGQWSLEAEEGTGHRGQGRGAGLNAGQVTGTQKGLSGYPVRGTGPRPGQGRTSDLGFPRFPTAFYILASLRLRTYDPIL